MASDMQYTHAGGMVFKGAHKMLVLEQEVAEALFGAKKAIVGYAGNSGDIGAVFGWLSNPVDKAPRVKNTELIVLTSNKEIYTNYNLNGWTFVDKPYYSIGSGSHFAMGAMAVGKGSAKAVAVACEMDPATGLGITEIKL
jgi:hypothetical protein